jgi:hypothetical protein
MFFWGDAFFIFPARREEDVRGGLYLRYLEFGHFETVKPGEILDF